MKIIDLREDEYRQDGLPYCKKCHTARASCFEGYTCRHLCKCQEETRQRQEEQLRLAERKQRADAYRANSELGKYFARCRFETARLTKYNRSVYEFCKKYCDKAAEMLDGGYGAYIYGNPGVGKTHLIACMGNALTDKLHTVFFTSFVKLEGQLKANFANAAAQAQLLQTVEKAEFLFLDDLGTENLKEGSNTWMQSIVFDVINRRYNAKKPIICTSNYTLADLLRKTNYEERTVHRLKEMCSYYTQLDCEIMRDAIAEEKTAQMLKIMRGG